MKIVYIRPMLDYKLLGTAMQLDKEKVYPAIVAKHIPDWKERGLVFVGDPDTDGILLEEGEYVVVKGYKPPPDID